MCGIAGFISRTAKTNSVFRAVDVLRNINYYNRLRGTDALGMFKVNEDYTFDLHKDVGDPYKLFNQKPFEKIHHWAEDRRYFVMHNRHATKGENNSYSAHPYVKPKKNQPGESIILVHNGTVNYIRGEETKQWSGKTDSEQISKMVAEDIPLNELDDRLFGAYALVWFDSSDNSLNFFRNNQRPFGFIETEHAIWFGSEAYAVAAALDRNGVWVKNIFFSKPLTHYRWSPESEELESHVIPPLKPGYSKSAKKEEKKVTTIDDDQDTALVTLEGSDNLDVIKNDNQGYSKSETKFFNPAEQVSVLPYKNTHTSSSVPSFKQKENHYSTSKKKKYGMVAEAMGHSVGDTIIFCLDDYSVTAQGQVKISGILVDYKELSASRITTPVLQPRIRIDGMTTIMITTIDKSNCLLSGIIRSMRKEDKAENYYFSLSDIKLEVDEPDTFDLLKRPGGTKTDNVIDAVIIDENKKEFNVPKEEPKDSGPPLTKREEKELKQSGVPCKHCVSCNGLFKTETLHRIKYAKNKEPDENSLILHLCGDCWQATICDDARLERLFNEAERDLAIRVAQLWDNTEKSFKPEGEPTIH